MVLLKNTNNFLLKKIHKQYKTLFCSGPRSIHLLPLHQLSHQPTPGLSSSTTHPPRLDIGAAKKCLGLHISLFIIICFGSSQREIKILIENDPIFCPEDDFASNFCIPLFAGFVKKSEIMERLSAFPGTAHQQAPSYLYN